MRRSWIALAILACWVVVGAACRGGTSTEPPIVPIRNMHDQPKYSVQGESAFFEDGRELRPPPAGTVSRSAEVDPVVLSGRSASGWLAQIPAKVVARQRGISPLAERGKSRFGIYCTPCHAADGSGMGSVNTKAKLGAFKAPSLHDDRIRTMPDGQLYGTITRGIRAMPAYAHAIPLDDRWAIVAYVRALQVQQLELAQK